MSEMIKSYLKNFGGPFQGEENFQRCYLASDVEAQLAVLPPAMTWTTDKPVKEGWYWWKDKWSHAAPVHVLAYATEKEDVLCFRPPIGPERRVNSDTGEWAGPIAPPEEA